MFLLKIKDFIHKHIVNRNSSLFAADIEDRHESLLNEIEGKSFLVIGGAGTIGASYIKSILPYLPGKITVVDYNENGLTELIRDLRSTPGLKVPNDIITYAFDFGSVLLEKLLRQNHYDVIACFAAHKHVRSEKDLLAVEAMITNNVFNTQRLLHLASIHQPDHVFAVSTDKAANPVNVMGGSKKLMEQIIMSYAPKVNATTARFANVAFSNGSLPDGFINRFANGQPLSAPQDVRRYFVTPAESGQICMLASLLGETADIFFPRLEESSMKSFSEIADAFLSELGYQPDQSESEEEAKQKAARWKPDNKLYPVYYFDSDTTGEKPVEEFFTEDEELDFNSFTSLGIVKNAIGPAPEEMQHRLDLLHQMFNDKRTSKEDIIHFMKKHIPGFDHLETGKNLDSRM